MVTKKPRTSVPKKALKKKPATRRSPILLKIKTGLKKAVKKTTTSVRKKPAKKPVPKTAKIIAAKHTPLLKKTLKKSAALQPLQKRKKPASPPKLRPPQKTAVRKARPLVKPFVESEKLPVDYGNPSISLMPRDPHWIYAYWDVSEFALKRAADHIGPLFKNSKFTIRVQDAAKPFSASKTAPASFDVDVDPHAGGWYVNVSHDNMTYFADFGVRTPKGDFYSIARSNTVSTPPATETRQPKISWKKIVENRNALFVVDALAPKPQAVETIRQASVRAPAPAGPLFLNEARITEKDVRDYYAAHFAALEKISSLASEQARSRNEEPDKGDLSRFENLPEKVEDTAFSQKLSLEAKNNISVFENSLIGAKPEGRTVESARVSFGAEQSAPGGASERLLTRPAFFFELETQLIVYGKTEPFSEVWMGTHKIDVREDGSFSLRLALPEGSVPLDFTAQSRDKTVKTIITAVHRAPLRYL